MKHNHDDLQTPVIIHQAECAPEGWDDPEIGKVQWRTLLSADRTRTHSLTCGVSEIGPGYPDALFLHSHAQVEVYYVLSGVGSVHIEGQEYPVRAGSAVFIPGNAVHGVRNTGAQALELLYIFAADSFDEIYYEYSSAPEK